MSKKFVKNYKEYKIYIDTYNSKDYPFIAFGYDKLGNLVADKRGIDKQQAIDLVESEIEFVCGMSKNGI